MSWEICISLLSFPLRGSHYRKVAQEQHFLGATNSQSPVKRLCFSQPNHWVAQLWWRNNSGRPRPELSALSGTLRLTSQLVSCDQFPVDV